MPNSNPDQPTGDEPTTPPEGDPGGEEAAPESEPEQQPATEFDALPERTRKEITDLRAEAANYRAKLRAVEAQLEAAKTPEQVEELLSEVRADNERLERALLVRDVADKHRLPAELREVLKGNTEAELDAHAQVLARFVPDDEVEIDPETLGGGLDPLSQDMESNDPGELARKYGRGRRRRR